MDPVFYTKEWLLSVLDFVERHLFANCDLYGFIEFVNEIARHQLILLR